MQIQNFTYLGLLLITIAYPIYKTFDPRLRFHKKLVYILPAIIVTAIPFLIWDVIFEHHQIWSFNSDYTLGINILGLPLEEWLFFFIVPYACFFIYEVVKYFSKVIKIPYIKRISTLIAILLLTAGILFNHLDYTFVGFILASGVLFIIVFNQKLHSKLSGYFKGYIVSLLPFFLVNGILTKMPVVLYNNNENLSFRIYTIPIEDMVYLLSLLFINFAIYETIKQYAEKEKPTSENRN